MPTEQDLQDEMLHRRQYIYVIEDSVGSESEHTPERESIFARMYQLLCQEARSCTDVDFFLQRVRYRNDFTWNLAPMAILPSAGESEQEDNFLLAHHEESVWQALSDSIYEVGKKGHLSGHVTVVPVFIIFVNNSRNFETILDDRMALADNAYYRVSMNSYRRIVMCSDAIWDNEDQIRRRKPPYDANFIYPFLMASRKDYVSGELYSELLTLHSCDRQKTR